MVEPITVVRHGGATEVRGGTIGVLGKVELSRAWLWLQGDLLDDLGLGLGFDKVSVSSAACMAA